MEMLFKKKVFLGVLRICHLFFVSMLIEWVGFGSYLRTVWPLGLFYYFLTRYEHFFLINYSLQFYHLFKSSY